MSDPFPPTFHRTFSQRLRSWFFTGLVVFCPIAMTAYVAWWVVDTIDNWVRPWLPDILSPDVYLPFHIPGFGVVIAMVGTGQFTTNGGTNFLVTNTADHHLYDWWISTSGQLQGIDLGAYWSNVALIAVGTFDSNTTNTEFLVQNTVDNHLYEWWINSQGTLVGIDLGAHWGNIQLIDSGHFNGQSANNELLVRNTADGHFYEWWVSNNQLQGVDLGTTASSGASTGGQTASANPASIAAPQGERVADAAPANAAARTSAS